MKGAGLSKLTIASLVFAAVIILVACGKEPPVQEYELPKLYKSSMLIHTRHTAVVSCLLAKGEKLEAEFHLKAVRSTRLDEYGRLMESITPGGEIVFYITDSSYQRVLDAGRVRDRYSFEVESEVTQRYFLFFIDQTRWGHRIIFNYNCPSPLKDVTWQYTR